MNEDDKLHTEEKKNLTRPFHHQSKTECERVRFCRQERTRERLFFLFVTWLTTLGHQRLSRLVDTELTMNQNGKKNQLISKVSFIDTRSSNSIATWLHDTSFCCFFAFTFSYRSSRRFGVLSETIGSANYLPRRKRAAKLKFVNVRNFETRRRTNGRTRSSGMELVQRGISSVVRRTNATDRRLAVARSPKIVDERCGTWPTSSRSTNGVDLFFPDKEQKKRFDSSSLCHRNKFSRRSIDASIERKRKGKRWTQTRVFD